jgi:hypothetical protein
MVLALASTYYDGDEGWLDLGTQQFSIVYSVGTQVYKNFPSHGFYWGEIYHREQAHCGWIVLQSRILGWGC